MLTKRNDVDKLDQITPQEELEFIQVVNQKEGVAVGNQRLLSAACLFGYPQMVKHLLNKTRADGSPVYTYQDVEDALSEIIDHGVLEKYKEYYPHQIYPLDTSEEGSKNRELCFRLIVSEVITDLQERRRVNKDKINFIADLLQKMGHSVDISLMTPNTLIAFHSLPGTLLMTNTVEKLAKPFLEFLGLEMCDTPYKLPKYHAKLYWHARDQNDEDHQWLVHS